MWSKIKNSKCLTISTKMTLLYTGILFCVLLLTSLMTICGLRYVLTIYAKKEMASSIANVRQYIEAGNPVDERLLARNFIATGLIMRVYDAQGQLLLDNNPYFSYRQPPEWPHGLERHNSIDSYGNEKTSDVVYEEVTGRGESFTLHFIRPSTLQDNFLRKLSISLQVTNFIGLLIALGAGMAVSRRILQPLRRITATAREIEINNLGQRIDDNGNNDELSELARTFNYMLDRIQAGFERQRRFVSDASHELRTPVTIISGYADMLDRWGKNDPTVLDEGLMAVKHEAESMQNLIKKMLYLARADQGIQIMNKTPLATQAFIKEIYQETCLIAPSHQVLLAQNEEAQVMADADSLKQMLRIFIENSIKYTPAGGEVIIGSRRDKTALVINVSDNGIGIPSTDHDNIFERFYRVDKSRTKETGGSGLGLAIARWIAEQHNIEIKVKSNVGEGTAIIVKIPLIIPE